MRTEGFLNVPLSKKVTQEAESSDAPKTIAYLIGLFSLHTREGASAS